MDIVTRVYGVLLYLLPPALRREAAADLTAWVTEASAVARRNGSGARARLVLLLLLDFAAALPGAWLHPPTRPHRPVVPVPGASRMETLWQDLRFALRSLRSAPTVALVAALTIAIGVAATTTMFSIANALMLRPPVGVNDPGRLVTVHRMDEKGSGFHSFSYPDFRDLAAAGSDAAQLSAFTMLPASVRTGAEPRLEAGMLVSASYFPVLGVHPALGRFFTAEEDHPGGPQVVVIGHGLWQRTFGGDPAILGRAITVNGHPLTVVGVTEAGFHGHIAAIDFSLWVPVTLMPLLRRGDLLSRNSSSLEIVGRLQPGVQRAQAGQQLRAISIQIGHDNGLTWDRGVDVRRYLPLPAEAAVPAGGFLALLVALGGLVLLIASANVANMLLARAATRQREVGIRLALGASRLRLIRQLITESILLFLAGGVVGTFLAVAAVRAIGRLSLPVPLPVVLDFHPDYRVLIVALTVTLATGLVFGLLPALQASRTDLAAVMRPGSGLFQVGRWRLRGVMVAAQVAGTAFLLVVAGLFVRALGRAGDVNVGFNPAGVHVMAMELRVTNYADDGLIAFADRLQQRMAAIPGVQSVAATDFLPLDMSTQQTMVALDGRPAEPGVGFFETDFAAVTPGYFATLELPIARGRSFAEADRAGAPNVAILNETLAARLWPGEDPIGKHLRFGSITDGTVTEVVGIARNAKYRSLGDHDIPAIYLPLAQGGARNLTLLIRTAPGIPAPTRQLREVLREVDPDLPLAQDESYSAIIGLALLPNRVAMGLAGLFGATGLMLAVVGLFGLLAYRVQARRKEIGIRLALGAGSARIRQMIVREAIVITLAGLGVGFVCAAGVSQLLGNLLFGLSPLDPVTYLGIALLLGGAGWLAAMVPAQRALRTEPLEVLRHE